MFTTGQWIFAALFFVAFVIALSTEFVAASDWIAGVATNTDAATAVAVAILIAFFFFIMKELSLYSSKVISRFYLVIFIELDFRIVELLLFL